VADPDEAAETAALLVLRCLPGVGDRTTIRLVEEFGSARRALEAPTGAFAAWAGKDAARARNDPAVRDRARQAEKRARESGVGIVRFGGPAYPPALLQLHDPPPVIFLRGDASLLDPPAVAVVGSRKATVYGRRTAETIGGALARAGIPVVSGLALGIDAAAHRGALAAEGRVVGVLGAGVDVPHPPANSGLFRIVGRDHLLVSEFLPGERPYPHHFPRRNRILAALSSAVVVVEAARRSGALITVDHAMDLGRDVLAVPGRVDSRTSRGTNRLLQDGAQVVVDPLRIVELLSMVLGRSQERSTATVSVLPAPAGVGGEIWRALEGGGLRADALARELEMDAGRVLAALSRLEVEGWVEVGPGMTYFRRG